MAKCDKKCDSSSSSSSSSDCTSSSKTCKVKCEKDCKKKCCKKSCLKCKKPEIIACEKFNAVVNIHSEYIFVGTSITTGSQVAATPLGNGTRADLVIDSQGCFVGKSHYIITTASAVTVPAVYSSAANRYPFLNKGSALPLTGAIYNIPIRASRVLVDVQYVNNEKCSFTYEADIVGIDGAGNFAVLKINMKKQWNKCNPCIKECHPYFKFGSSRQTKRGTKAYILGDVAATNKYPTQFDDFTNQFNNGFYTNGVKMITAGVVTDNRYVDHTGWILHESVVVDAYSTPLCRGGPILNCEGKIIAIVGGNLNNTPGGNYTSLVGGLDYNTRDGSGLTFGPSSLFFKRAFRTILKGTGNKDASKYLTYVSDPAGAYTRYIKGYLGVGYDVFDGSRFDSTVDFTTTPDFPYGSPRVRLDSNGNFVNTPDPSCDDVSMKRVEGIRVLSLAGSSSNNHWFTPGTTGAAVPFPFNPASFGGVPTDSPALGVLQVGDLIVSVNNVILGDGPLQITPTLITWRLASGDRLDVVYRRGGNLSNATNPNTTAGNYQDNEETSIVLADFPALLDFPWYSINSYPVFSNYGFTLPNGLLQFPQLPQTLTSGAFHPAF